MKQKKTKIRPDKEHAEITGIGVGTGVYCTSVEFEGLLEIINEVRKTSMIQVVAGATSGVIEKKMVRTQQDVFLRVAVLAEKHNLPSGFYAINKNREFICMRAREDDAHTIYEL